MMWRVLGLAFLECRFDDAEGLVRPAIADLIGRECRPYSGMGDVLLQADGRPQVMVPSPRQVSVWIVTPQAAVARFEHPV